MADEDDYGMVGAEGYDPRSLATTARARRNIRARGDRAAADAAMAGHGSHLYPDLGPMGRSGFGTSTSAAVAAASAAMGGVNERTPKLLPPAVAGGSLGITGPAPKRVRRPVPVRNGANPLDLSHLDDPDISLGPPDLDLEPADARSCRKAVVATTVDSLESLPWHELYGPGFMGSSFAARAQQSDEASASTASAATSAPAPAPTAEAVATPEKEAAQPRRTTRSSVRKQRKGTSADTPVPPVDTPPVGGNAAADGGASAAAASTTTAPDLKVSTFSELVHDVFNVPLPSTLPTIEELQYELREQQQRHAAQVAAFAAGHAAFAHQQYAFLGTSAAATSPTGPNAAVSTVAALPATPSWPSPSGAQPGPHEGMPPAALQQPGGSGGADDDAAAADAMSAADAAATALEAAARAMAASEAQGEHDASEGHAEDSSAGVSANV